MATWPTTLPQEVAWNNYKETTQPATLRSQPEAGPFKARPRFSAAMEIFSVMLVNLTSDQVDTLKFFYKTTCAMGSTPFDWVHPRSGNPAVLTFMSDTITVVGTSRNKFSASFDMAILP